MSLEELRKQYELANRLNEPAFLRRPYLGSPAAPAQAETNVSNIWGHINAGFLFAYEYTRWWKESHALRNTAVLGDWSWLNKTMVRGPDAARFMNYATVKDLQRQQAGQIVHTPMVSAQGKVAIEGLTLKFAQDEYLFTQSGARRYFEQLAAARGMRVEFEDVTPDYTCYALQGPRSTDVLEALTAESWRDLRFSRWRTTRLCGEDVIVGRQGVTGEVGYEFLMPTGGGRAHELWRMIRDTGRDFGLRELGFKAQMIGHTETGIATVIRDYLPARGSPDALMRMLRHWASAEELAAVEWKVEDQLCSPAELGWVHAVNLGKGDFHGREALQREADAGGPARRLAGLEWNSDDVAELFAAQFRDSPSAPPPDLPYGQFRVLFLKVLRDGATAGWASGWTYSPNLRRMISLARLDRSVEPGAEVRVRWGAFSDEPACLIRARVTELPFIRQNRTSDLAAGTVAPPRHP